MGILSPFSQKKPKSGFNSSGDGAAGDGLTKSNAAHYQGVIKTTEASKPFSGKFCPFAGAPQEFYFFPCSHLFNAAGAAG